MKLIRQPEHSNLCGQACVATIAGVSIEESIKAFGGTTGRTRTKQVIEAFSKLGVKCGDRLIRLSGRIKKSNFCIVKLHFQNYKHTHWTVYYNSLFYDPDIGILQDYPEGVRQTSFLPIYL
jgi:hypothetical protein